MKVVAKNIKECRALKALERARLDMLFWIGVLQHWELEATRLHVTCPWCGSGLPEALKAVKQTHRKWVGFMQIKVIDCHAEIERLVAEVEKEQSAKP